MQYPPLVVHGFDHPSIVKKPLAIQGILAAVPMHIGGTNHFLFSPVLMWLAVKKNLL